MTHHTRTYKRCPDDGVCHGHNCAPDNCMRVYSCGPLSGVFPNNRWPEHMTFDLELHEMYQVMSKLEDGITDK